MNKKNFFRINLVLLLCLSLPMLSLANLLPHYLRVEYKVNPYVSDNSPRLSWELTGKGFNQFQSAYQIIVASSEANLKKNIGDLWDSKKVDKNQTNQIVYAGKPLSSGQRVYWKVKVWDQKNKSGKWSETAYWELAKTNAGDWKATWIGVDLNHLAKKGEYHLPPSPYIRKEVELNKKIKSARLYVSSLGLHDFYINGEKVGGDYFGSGWTDYNKRVYYHVYDVTSQLLEGPNVFGAVLASGWYSGYLGYALLVGSPQVHQFYGKFPLMKAQIDVTYADGSKAVIGTDNSWKYAVGGVQEADFLEGETYDATQEPLGWNRNGFDEKGWKAVQEVGEKSGRALELYPSNPVRILETLPVQTVKKIADGKYIVDFGQNFAGIVRLKMKGKAGSKLQFRYGEMLYPDGTLMTENLRKARGIDSYTFRGDEKGEEWSPSFTFHGFQFVEVSGLDSEPSKDFLTGLVLSSDLETTGHFKTDNEMLNQLYSNIIWTQRANYLDIPTDCPQRDERLGWTGDAQIYMRSAIFNADVAPFHTKWIKDLNDAQWPNGAYPIYAPMPTNSKGVAAIRADDAFSPGWSEAGIICTYEIFRAYNDHRIVKESLPYMTKFMEFLKKRAKSGVIREGSFEDVTPKGGFGDWLSVGPKTSPDLLATTYYYYCTKLMSEMCSSVGEQQLAQAYTAELEVIRNGFKQHYMGSDGKLKTNAKFYGNGEGYVEGQNGFSGHTQTAYANAIYSGILTETDAVQAGKYLRELVEQNGDKLTTGFLGFKPLLPALSKSGSNDKAYKLIQSTEYPSLGYEVVNGATSIWERWDSYIKDKGFVHNAAMNSFSHYAFGSVNEWMFEEMLGIKARQHGYQQIEIKPEIGNYGINQASGYYHSIAGVISSSWENTAQGVKQEVVIPVNVTAYCYVKAENPDQIRVNSKAVNKLKQLRSMSQKDGFVVLELGSGKYTIQVNN